MTVIAQASRLIPAKPEKVWKTLTSPKGMKAYMMGADVETDWRVGRPIVMKGEHGGKRFEDRGEVRSFEPGRRFSYTHQSGGEGPVRLVTFELQPAGDESRVTVTQENEGGQVTETDRQRRSDYEKTWTMMLEEVEKSVRS